MFGKLIDISTHCMGFFSTLVPKQYLKKQSAAHIVHILKGIKNKTSPSKGIAPPPLIFLELPRACHVRVD